MTIITDKAIIFNKWHKPKPITPPLVETKPGITIDQVRQEMALKIERHLINGQGMLVINVPAGVGKSYQALAVIEGITDTMPGLGHAAWFTSRHNGYNSLDRDDTIWLHVKGRYDDIFSSNGDVLESGNCPNAGCCSALGNKGYSPGIIFCPPEDEDKEPKHWQCSIPRSECIYWLQWTDPIHRYMPVQYITSGKLWGEWNRLPILDEIDAYSLTPQPVNINAEILGQWLDKYPQYENWIKPLINWLDTVSRHLADLDLQKALSEILPEIDIFSLDPEFLSDIPKDVEIELTGEKDLDNLPNRAVEKFLSEIYNMVWNSGGLVTRVVAHHNKDGNYFTLYPQADFDRQYIGNSESIPRFIDFSSVLLNATCEIEPLKELFKGYDYPLEVYQPHVNLHPESTVTYDISRNYAKGSLRAKDTRYKDQWINQIRKQAAQYPKSLVIATIPGEKILKTALRDEINRGGVYLAHYGNVSGLNEFEDCQQVILSQPFHPSPYCCSRSVSVNLWE